MTGLVSLERFYASATTLILTAVLTLGGCADTGVYQINMMPSPEVFEEGTIDPFIGAVPVDELPYAGMLDATFFIQFRSLDVSIPSPLTR